EFEKKSSFGLFFIEVGEFLRCGAPSSRRPLFLKKTDSLTPSSTSHFLFCLISWRSGEREHHRRTHTVSALLKEFIWV
ncbi:hypothetical protein XENOCAPTIV_019952, partial [Xenoophorus captivus]